MPVKNQIIQSSHIFNSEEAAIGNPEQVNEVKTYANIDEAKTPKTVFRGALMITNLCLGVTIFTFAVRITYFGLVWFIVTGIIVGIITYWSLMLGVIASSKSKEDDYS